jgi:hypothetical protein
MLVFDVDGYAALVLGYNSSPFVNLYTRDADTFTLQTTDAPSETSAVYHAAFSGDDEYLAHALASSPFVRIHKRTDDVYTAMPNPSTIPSQFQNAVSFTPNASHLAVCGGSPNLIIYKQGESYNLSWQIRFWPLALIFMVVPFILWLYS